MAQSKESIRLGTVYLKMEAQPDSEMSCFKTFRQWTKSNKRI